MSKRALITGVVLLNAVAIVTTTVTLKISEAAAVLQAFFLLETLALVWFYTEATLALATAADAEFRNKWTREIVQGKPVVFTDRRADGYVISNAGAGLAANVWCLVEGYPPVPFGSLKSGDSVPLDRAPAPRHLLIAEARPGTRRRWTVTMNIVGPNVVVHGFAHLGDALEFEGPLSEFVSRCPNLFDQLNAFEIPGERPGAPLTAAPTGETE
ncbi:MAG: hypothetical protein IT177_18865 [Acidobacteria bacterium]|nr:hypothetical protein [Acidobacteriota bacterium]